MTGHGFQHGRAVVDVALDEVVTAADLQVAEIGEVAAYVSASNTVTSSSVVASTWRT